MVALGRCAFIAGLVMAPAMAPVLAVAAPQADSASSVVAPRDVSTGMASGKRIHKPITITKEWGSREAAAADCTALHASLSEAGGKLACVADLDGDGMADVCARAGKMGAACVPK
jgi:hypothetical protein